MKMNEKTRKKRKKTEKKQKQNKQTGEQTARQPTQRTVIANGSTRTLMRCNNRFLTAISNHSTDNNSSNGIYFIFIVDVHIHTSYQHRLANSIAISIEFESN